MSFVTLENQDIVSKSLAKLAEAIDEKATLDVMQTAANNLAENVRTAAPLGPTGNLKKGIVAKVFKEQRKGDPSSFVGIDYGIAPHAHLVEFGTVKAAPHPFFRHTIDTSKESVRRDISDGLKKVIFSIVK